MRPLAQANPVRSKKSPVTLVTGLLMVLLLAGCVDSMEDVPDAEDGQSEDEPGTPGTSQGDEDAASGNHSTNPEDQKSEDEDDDPGDGANGNGSDETDDGQEDDDGGQDGDEEGPDDDEEDGTDEDETGPNWPEPHEATLRPGMRVYTGETVQSVEMHCTANFLFQSGDGSLFIGTSAACMTEYTIGDEVPVRDLDTSGRLAYSGWWDGQQHDNANGHDFALVALDEDGRGEAHPAVFHYGGPVRVADPLDLQTQDTVVWYGNTTRPPEGAEEGGEGYVCNVTSDAVYLRPVVPVTTFDRGAGVMDSDGNATGILTGLTIEDDTCGVGVRIEPLPDALEQARSRGVDVQLVPWSAFQGGLLPTVPP